MDSTRVRRAAVAGTFYPSDPLTLASQVDRFLGEAAAGVLPKALIVPHAGYVYSGPVAGSAYALLCGVGDRFRRVVLLGPTHHVFVEGMAVPTVDWFETPLGRIALDCQARDRVVAQGLASARDDAHQAEHSLEVQLPFLQRSLTQFALLPVVVGLCPPKDVARLIDSEWGDEQTLLVVSSDLSHFLSYDQAREQDRLTARRILDLETGLDGEQACGCHAVNGLLLSARLRHMRVKSLDIRNSGDTAGPHDRVVGYGAFALYET